MKINSPRDRGCPLRRSTRFSPSSSTNPATAGIVGTLSEV